MVISYEIILTIVNLGNEETKTFTKSFNDEIKDLEDDKLYNNHHLLKSNAKMFSLFKKEINSYCKENGITMNNIDIDEFNINSLSDDIQVYFEPGDGDDPEQISLEPNIKCYIPPQFKPLDKPVLNGKAYDNSTIIWSWADDGLAHYLVTENIDIANKDEQDKIIAQIPIGSNIYTETGLESNTAYTRRLISYDANHTSVASSPMTVTTEVAPLDKSLDKYKIDKNYDYTSDDAEREFIDESLEAFHSGIGDYNDLRVYKQMDTGFFQKFKPYIQIRGVRTQREKCYDTVGFHYKVCLEAEETVEEQKGEVTFDIDLFPRENVTIKDYMYATKPVTICARLSCDVLLKKPDTHQDPVEVPLLEPEWKKAEVPNEERPPVIRYNPLHLVLCLDLTRSLPVVMLGAERPTESNYKSAIKKMARSIYTILNKLKKFYKNSVDEDGKPGKIKVSIVCFKGRGDTFAKHINLLDPLGNTNVTGKGLRLREAISYIGKNKTKFVNKFVSVIYPEGWSKSGGTGTDITNWGAGLAEVKTLLKKDAGDDRYDDYENMLLFYSDGGANTNKNGTLEVPKDHVWKKDDSNRDVKKVMDDIERDARLLKKYIDICFCLIPDGNKLKSDYGTYTKGYLQKIGGYVKNTGGKLSDIYEWDETTEISEVIRGFIKNSMTKDTPYPPYLDQHGNPTTEEFHYEGWEFNNWKKSNQTLTIDTDWNIDDSKWARVTVPPLSEDPWMIEINNTMTPILYARNERRAIIPEDHIIQDYNFDPLDSTRMPGIQIDNRSIYQMIMDSIPETEEYKQGYTEVVHAYTEEEQKEGPYLIRGINIKDTYKWDDDETIPTVDPIKDAASLNDGYAGSFNVYTNINKLGTAEYGDDIYFAAEDKYVWASGYTDAIIYDGERIVSTELNAYDHPSEIIIATQGNYAGLLTCRDNKAIVYNDDNSKIFHVAEVILKDQDIYITNDSGEEELNYEGDWTLFVPQGTDTSKTDEIIRGTSFPVIKELNGSITAHNDVHFRSPILNYRFNIIDPNAYTSYYEILPGSDPDSPYQNIVALHIYYARNIFIQDKDPSTAATTKYIASFGDNNIATTSSPFYENSQLREGLTLLRNDYIDTYLWFEARPMLETKTYYDEKPNEGMDSLYGSVNGRYGNTNRSGRKELRELTPQFNIPTTIKHPENINIYIMINEYNPEDALVSYRWDHPSDIKDSITNKNGDYVTFSSDSLTYKDVEYTDLVETITEKSISVYDNKTTTYYFEIEKPQSKYEYNKYLLELVSDNSDVMILNYPKEIIFPEDGNNRVQISADCKGVVNATTQWAPRIHNGYYYLNQHEYYAFSEFDVEADFVIDDEENYDTTGGYITIDVDLVKKAGPTEHYEIVKNTRAELIQNEKEFEWITGKGLTMKPIIDGEYYKEYVTRTYKSPVILFPNVLTSADLLQVTYYIEGEDHSLDSEEELQFKVRSYDLENGEWSEWVDFVNNTVPNVPLSCGYQVSFNMSASVKHYDVTLEDYLCCYLDWEDEQEPQYHKNIVTITDHLQAGPYESEGVFMSKLIDYGTKTDIMLDIYASDESCKLYIAISNDDEEALRLENCQWIEFSNPGLTVTARYLRYKVVIPYGEKVYWVHKKLTTKQSEVSMPILTQIQMNGDYTPSDVRDSFQEIQSFEIATDGRKHRLFPSIYDIISTDVIEKGFEPNEIHYIRIKSSNSSVGIDYDANVQNEYPGIDYLRTPIYGTGDFKIKIDPMNTPYIYAQRDLVRELDTVYITRGTPQQFSPIVLEDYDGTPYQRIYDIDPDTLFKKELYTIETEDDSHYIKISRNDFDIKTFSVLLNDEPFSDYRIVNNLIIFGNQLAIGDILEINYRILNSFYAIIDYEKDTTKLILYSDYDKEEAKKTDIESLEPIVNTHAYNKYNVQQMYLNGTKQRFKESSITETNLWKYSADLSAIYMSANDEDFCVIVNTPLPTSSYNLSSIVYSTNTDNDVIGLVIGYIKDNYNKPHTLSYLISLKGQNSFTFNNDNTAIVYDYGMSSELVLKNKNINTNDYKFWNEIGNGIKISVNKNNNQIRCFISEWNSPEIPNQNSILELDTEELDITKAFTGSVCTGYCTRSQENTYFTNTVFSGIIDKTVTIDEQMLRIRRKYKVFFETNETNNKFIANKLSLNPIYRTDYKGFIYLTDEHNEPYYLNIHCNPKYLNAGGYDKIDIVIECLDYIENPVISKDVYIDCKEGVLTFDNDLINQTTDINGVIHMTYESALVPCTDTITARTITSSGKVIESTVEIINE